MQDNEIWKDVKGYKGIYEVSSLGRIKRTLTTNQTQAGKILVQSTSAGYLSVGLSYGKNKIKSYRVHRLVAVAFIDNPHSKRCVNHKDGNKSNNSVSNLEWATHKENTAHAWKNNLNKAPNTGKFGESHGRSKMVLATNLITGEHKEVCGILNLCRILNIGSNSVDNYLRGKTKQVNHWVFKLI